MAEKQAETGAAAAEAKTAEVGLLDTILEKGLRAKDEDARQWGRDLIKEFVAQLLDPNLVVAKDTEKTIKKRIEQIDALLSAQLNEIMHQPDLQKLEASWRGLHYLVHNSETGTTLKIKVLNASKKDLLNDLERASEFDQSGLFKKAYEDEYGMFGGEPYGALIGDYDFGNHPQDIALLERVSNVAAAAHAPFIAAASAGMFGLESFTDLNKPRDLSKIFDTVEYAKWRSFRESEDSRYVALTMPRVLGRLPYGKETVPVEAFDFEEVADGHEKYLWTNAAYSYGTRLTDAFARDKIGSFMERSDVEDWLNRWILRYVLENPESAGQRAKAEKPLRAARVEVRDVKGKPGSYEAVAYLRPHFQMEELGVSLRLVAELPQAKG
jgi:type VI secretion system protein ImpC